MSHNPQNVNRSSGSRTPHRTQATVNGAPVQQPTTSNVVPIRQAIRPSGPAGNISAETKAPAARDAQEKNFKELEDLAAQIIVRLKNEAKNSYAGIGKAGEDLRYGGPFLHNKAHIEKLRLFRAAKMAPKGAHLHIHLNACLGPEVLLNLAASETLKNNMYISTNLQDGKKVATMRQKRKDAVGTKSPIPNLFKEPLTNANIENAKFQFHFLPYGWDRTCSLFSPDYHGRIEATEKAEGKTYDVMKFTDFLTEFDKYIKTESGVQSYNGSHPERCMNWLIKKLVFQKEDMDFDKRRKEPSNDEEPKAIERQWALFNTRTQMMKGLFLAEHAYREYLKALFSSFAKDNIQYAELRPNFMQANSVIRTSRGAIPIPGKPGEFSYDPKNMMNNEEIMGMIIDEFKNWKSAHPKATFKSMKVIMCTPRSIYPGSDVNITKTLEECYRLKQMDEYREWIAGFDFVGPELNGRTLKELEPWFKQWNKKYQEVGLKWILHCGESIYDKHGNVQYALDNLNPHRLAHGYAIQNLELDEPTKKKLQSCCIETCPDSNENLGLAQDASCAVVYPLMKQNIPCSVSCDNPTLFNSTLSDEFYQVMVGDENFSLKHWKKLMTDSIKYSVWKSGNDQTKVEVMGEWNAQYKRFIQWLVSSFNDVAADGVQTSRTNHIARPSGAKPEQHGQRRQTRPQGAA